MSDTSFNTTWCCIIFLSQIWIDRFGNIEDKENPAIKVKLNYQTKYATLCNQLGLSPASRANLAGLQAKASEEEKDPLLQILKEGI